MATPKRFKRVRTRGGSDAVIFWSDHKFIYGAYDDGEDSGVLYPGRWYHTGHYWPQSSGQEYTTSLDLLV